MEPCPICNKVFSSINSLRTHKSRFHRSKKKILNNADKKVSPSQSTFGRVISRRVINRKRYPSNQDLSDKAENVVDSGKAKLMGKKLTKKRPVVSEETSEDSDIDSKRGYKRRKTFKEIYAEHEKECGDKTFKEIRADHKKECDEYFKTIDLEIEE